MRLLFKRGIALIIDGFLFGLLYVPCEWYISNRFQSIGSFGYLILFLPFFLKDLAFGKVSIGKKILGLQIFDINCQKPKSLILIKRAILMSSLGYLVLLKAIFIENNIVSFFDWEERVLKTRVVEKKYI